MGPFQPSALPEVHVNSFGVISKSEQGKWCLIVDMSSPEGGSDNEGICKEWCSLSYISVDDVAREVVPNWAKELYNGKVRPEGGILECASASR